MFLSKGEKATIEFLRHIEVLGKNSSTRLVDGSRGEETEKEFIKKVISDAQELIEVNEWVIGLENLLTNLYEINFKLDTKAIVLAKAAIESSKMDYADWKFIEELNQ